MSPKRQKKFVKFSKYIKGKLRNRVFCSCRQCNVGDQSKYYQRYKIGRAYNVQYAQS